jgi:hypothetical protein
MTLSDSTVAAPQERLLAPPRHKQFCPGEHCTKPCGPTNCTCGPCGPSCKFCNARKRNAKPPVEFEIQTDFSHRQLSLIPDFKANNQRSKK